MVSVARSVHSHQTAQPSGRPRQVIKPYVVVIFGRTGVGISSLVNLITGHPVSNDHPNAKTSSRKLIPYCTTLPGSNKQFCLYEVPGFGGGSPDATILKTIQQIERNEGIDLFIYCFRKQRTTIIPKTVRHIWDSVPGEKPPMIAVVTELERFATEGEMEDWWDVPLEDGNTNGTLVERMCFEGHGRFDGYACITTLPRREVDLVQTLRKRRDRSEEQIRQLILEYCRGHKRRGG